jgi:hypothetical protein
VSRGPYDHEFVIADAPLLRGRVIDLVTNEPIAGAEIVPLGMGLDIGCRAATTTDSTGAFELRGDLTAWSGFGFEARKEGYASTRRELDDEDTDWSGASELVLGLVRECVVEGTVTNERGEAVVGATIFADHERRSGVRADVCHSGGPRPRQVRCSLDVQRRPRAIPPSSAFPRGNRWG